MPGNVKLRCTIQSLEMQSETKNMQQHAIYLEINGYCLFSRSKRQYLKLQTSKLKMVKSFEKFGKNFINQDLFGYIDAF